VPYVAHAYPPERHSAEEVAALIGLPPERVFKTLVALRETPRARPLLAIVPGPAELDLKRLAQAVGEKRVRMATQRDAERLTGLQVGGISALALLHKGFEVWLDEAALGHQQIAVSAGQRGLNVEVPVAALIELTGARVAALSELAVGHRT
jgi:Cys-tRNA(Pro)/Cys-tRNA(Cys) deacylase